MSSVRQVSVAVDLTVFTIPITHSHWDHSSLAFCFVSVCLIFFPINTKVTIPHAACRVGASPVNNDSILGSHDHSQWSCINQWSSLNKTQDILNKQLTYVINVLKHALIYSHCSRVIVSCPGGQSSMKPHCCGCWQCFNLACTLVWGAPAQVEKSEC